MWKTQTAKFKMEKIFFLEFTFFILHFAFFNAFSPFFSKRFVTNLRHHRIFRRSRRECCCSTWSPTSCSYPARLRQAQESPFLTRASCKISCRPLCPGFCRLPLFLFLLVLHLRLRRLMPPKQLPPCSTHSPHERGSKPQRYML